MRTMNNKTMAMFAVLAICCSSCLGMTLVSDDSDADLTRNWTVGTAISNNGVYVQPQLDASLITFTGSVPGVTLSVKNLPGPVGGVFGTGTPTTAGTYTIKVYISGSLAETVNVVVANASGGSGSTGGSTTITSYEEVKEATVGTAFNYAAPGLEIVSGSVPGCTVSNEVNAGNLFLRIYGTPTTAGTYVVSAKNVVEMKIDGKTLPVESTYTVKVNVSNGSFTHTVHYDANGGTGAPADTVVTDSVNGNSTVTLSGSQPTRSGYTFAGWYTAASGGSKVTSVSVGANATTTVYAHWTQNTLSIGSVAKQFAVVGGSVSFAGSCTSTPSGASVSYTATNVQSVLNVNVSGNTVTCSSSTVGTYTFTLNASASNYSGSSTTVTVQFVPVLAFSNTPSAGALNA